MKRYEDECYVDVDFETGDDYSGMIMIQRFRLKGRGISVRRVVQVRVISGNATDDEKGGEEVANKTIRGDG